jgi:hypothetical protein
LRWELRPFGRELGGVGRVIGDYTNTPGSGFPEPGVSRSNRVAGTSIRAAYTLSGLAPLQVRSTLYDINELLLQQYHLFLLHVVAKGQAIHVNTRSHPLS